MSDSQDPAGKPGRPRSHKKSPSVRVNNSKVTPLSRDSLQKVEPKSKFSEWRRQSRKQEASEDWSNVTELRSVPSASTVESERSSEVRRKMWKKIWMSVGALLVAAVLFIGIVFFSPLLATRTITVEGAELLSISTVQEKLQPLDGRPLTRISESDVKALVGKSNVLRDVTIEARPPHELVVTLHERIPVAVVKDGNQMVLVDAEGVELSRTKNAEDAGLPEISGGTGVLGSEEFKLLTSVLAALPQSLLSEVKDVKAESASTISLNMKDGTEVIWGTAEESELKAKVLIQLRQAVGESTTVKTYDVSSPMVPTTK